MAILGKARELLENVTPLSGDCGRHCGARCCAAMEGEETGMLLFPGEEALMGDRGRMLNTESGMLWVCDGSCSRAERPLSCRLFPLFPCVRDGKVSVEIDERARLVCPLCRSGLQGMQPAFREQVRACGELLMESSEQRAFLEKMTREIDDLKALRKRFRA